MKEMAKESNIVLERGHIVMVDFGENKGSIQGGLRPCIIVSNSASCKFSPVVICVPLTSNTNKKRLPTHTLIKPSINDNHLRKASVALCEQIITIAKDSIRFITGKLNCEDCDKINECIKVSLALS